MMSIVRVSKLEWPLNVLEHSYLCLANELQFCNLLNNSYVNTKKGAVQRERAKGIYLL